MEGQVVLNGSTRLDSLYLQGRADVGQGRWAKRQRFGMVLLPSLVLGSQVEGAGVLEVWWKHDGLVASFAGKLDAQIPCIEGNEDEVQVLRVELL